MRKGSTAISMGGKETREDEGQVPAKTQSPKPPFRPVRNDTKPLLRDPISRSDPIETEQAVLRLPPFNKSQLYSKQSGCRKGYTTANDLFFSASKDFVKCP